MKAWEDNYKGILEYRPNSELRDVDVASRTAILEFDKVKGRRAQRRAAAACRHAGRPVGRQARQQPLGRGRLDEHGIGERQGIHILGDSTLSAPLMPKSGFMANQHGKVAAARSSTRWPPAKPRAAR